MVPRNNKTKKKMSTNRDKNKTWCFRESSYFFHEPWRQKISDKKKFKSIVCMRRPIHERKTCKTRTWAPRVASSIEVLHAACEYDEVRRSLRSHSWGVENKRKRTNEQTNKRTNEQKSIPGTWFEKLTNRDFVSLTVMFFARCSSGMSLPQRGVETFENGQTSRFDQWVTWKE